MSIRPRSISLGYLHNGN